MFVAVQVDLQDLQDSNYLKKGQRNFQPVPNETKSCLWLNESNYSEKIPQYLFLSLLLACKEEDHNQLAIRIQVVVQYSTTNDVFVKGEHPIARLDL